MFNVIRTENAYIPVRYNLVAWKTQKTLQQMPEKGYKTRTWKYFSRAL